MSRKIFKKLYITGRLLNRIITFVIVVICSIFIYAFVNYIINFFGTTTSYLYEQNAHNVSHAYAKLTDSLVGTTKACIKILATDNQMNTEKTEDIVKYFDGLRICIPKHFQTFEYADLAGNLITLKNNSVNISEYSGFQKILENPVKDEFLIDSSAYSIILNKNCIIFYYPHFIGDQLKGVIITEIPLEFFQKVAEDMVVSDYNRICLVNEKNVIIYHSNPKYMYRNFVYPESYDENSSEDRLKMFEDNINFDGKNYIFIEKMPEKNWKTVVVLPNETINKTYISINKMRFIIILILCVVILVIVIMLISFFRIINGKYDSSTCVYSQEYFEKRANKILRKNYSNRYIVIAGDIRGIKFINQDKGFEIGNKVIASFAQIFKTFIRKNKGICAHSYADHFYALIKIDSICEAIDSISHEFRIIDRRISFENFHVYAKYGLTIVNPSSQYNAAKRNIKQFIGQAVFAKSLIKTNINKSFEFYSSKIEEKVRHEQLIEQEIEKAVMNDEFYVVYQPKINLKTEKIIGSEALVRWHSSNPMLGLLSPGSFLPVFEKNGFIEELDFIVYEKVFKFIREQLDLKKSVVPISINISRVHLSKTKFPGFISRFMTLFNKYEIPAKYVEIEILEQSSGGDSDFLIIVIDEFHRNGFSVAMDDFGSGESSLNMLNTLPIDIVKFDQNFLNNEKDYERTVKIVTTLVKLGKQLKKVTIFEGVETEEQKNFLKSIGCDIVQGYFYSKPLKQAEYENFVESHVEI